MSSIRGRLDCLMHSLDPQNAVTRKKRTNAAFELLLLCSLKESKANTANQLCTQTIEDAVLMTVAKLHPQLTDKAQKLIGLVNDKASSNMLYLLLLLSNKHKVPETNSRLNTLMLNPNLSFVTSPRKVNKLFQKDARTKIRPKITEKGPSVKRKAASNLFERKLNPKLEQKLVNATEICIGVLSLQIAISDVLVGIQNPLFYFDSELDRWCLTEGWCLENGEINMLFPAMRSIFDAGSHYSFINDFLHDSTRNVGCFLWSHFICCVKHLLLSYAYDVSLVTRAREHNFYSLFDKLEPFLSAIRVLSEICEKMKQLAETESNETTKCLLDFLYEMMVVSNVSEYVYNILLVLFATCYEIYVRELLEFVDKGPGYANSVDLFLKCNLSSLACRDRLLWKYGFYLETENFPEIFDDVLCKKLLYCAKLVHIASICLPRNDRELLWSSRKYWAYPRLKCQAALKFDKSVDVGANTTKVFDFQTFIPIEFEINRKLTAVVDNRFFKLNSAFMNHLYEDCELEKHWQNLREIFLCENGAFVACLAEKLYSKFSEDFDATFNSPSSLLDVIEYALDFGGLTRCKNFVQVSVASNEDTSILSQHSQASSHFTFDSRYRGIESILIKYKVAWPCNILIGSTCIDWYSQILVLLLQLHCLQYSLADVLVHLDESSTFTSREKHRIYLYRFTMQQFLAVVKDYLCTRLRIVCLDMKKDLCRESRYSKQGIDALYEIHKQHLSRAMCLCILNPRAKQIKDVFEQTLAQILKLRAAVVVKNDAQKADKIFHTFTSSTKYFVRLMHQLNSRGYESSLADLVLRLNFNGYMD